MLARLIWGIEFQAPIDLVSNKPIMNDEETTFTAGFISIVKIFPVIFHPGSAKKAEIIQKAFENAQCEWEVLELEKDIRT